MSIVELEFIHKEKQLIIWLIYHFLHTPATLANNKKKYYYNYNYTNSFAEAKFNLDIQRGFPCSRREETNYTAL